jgi:hypothetical protein
MSAPTTEEEVRKQLVAMCSARVDLGALSQARWMTLATNWSAKAMPSALRWLQHENARGAHIFIRPAGLHQLSLIDDLTAELREASGQMCPRAEEFFREITALVEREAAEQANRKAAASALSNITIKPPSAFHDNPRYGSDLHRADLAWAIYAASRGFSEQQIRMRFFMPEISQKRTCEPPTRLRRTHCNQSHQDRSADALIVRFARQRLVARRLARL